MTLSIRLSLPYPPSANAYWRASRGRGLVPSSEALRYKVAVATLAASEHVLPLKGPVRLILRAYRPRKMGDLDNVCKVLLDALQGWVYLDDGQVEALDAIRYDDADKPRVDVFVTGEAFATRAEADAHRRARTDRAAKARATRNRNRALRATGAKR